MATTNIRPMGYGEYDCPPGGRAWGKVGKEVARWQKKKSKRNAFPPNKRRRPEGGKTRSLKAGTIFQGEGRQGGRRKTIARYQEDVGMSSEIYTTSLHISSFKDVEE